jgi:hypothetical protein
LIVDWLLTDIKNRNDDEQFYFYHESDNKISYTTKSEIGDGSIKSALILGAIGFDGNGLPDVPLLPMFDSENFAKGIFPVDFKAEMVKEWEEFYQEHHLWNYYIVTERPKVENKRLFGEYIYQPVRIVEKTPHTLLIYSIMNERLYANGYSPITFGEAVQMGLTEETQERDITFILVKKFPWQI